LTTAPVTEKELRPVPGPARTDRSIVPAAPVKRPKVGPPLGPDRPATNATCPLRAGSLSILENKVGGVLETGAVVPVRTNAWTPPPSVPVKTPSLLDPPVKPARNATCPPPLSTGLVRLR
jgi:hypothetical protein